MTIKATIRSVGVTFQNCVPLLYIICFLEIKKLFPNKIVNEFSLRNFLSWKKKNLAFENFSNRSNIFPVGMRFKLKLIRYRGRRYIISIKYSTEFVWFDEWFFKIPWNLHNYICIVYTSMKRIKISFVEDYGWLRTYKHILEYMMNISLRNWSIGLL